MTSRNARIDEQRRPGLHQCVELSCHARRPLAGPRGRSPARRRSTPAPRRVIAGQHLVDQRGDIEESDAAFKERSDGDLIGGIEHGRLRPRLARARRAQAQRRKALLGRALRSRAADPTRSSGSHGVAIRSGQASVWAIGIRMSGRPIGRWSSMMKRKNSGNPASANADVKGIRRLVDVYTTDRRLLSKATVALYEAVQEFWVAARRRRPGGRLRRAARDVGGPRRGPYGRGRPGVPRPQDRPPDRRRAARRGPRARRGPGVLPDVRDPVLRLVRVHRSTARRSPTRSTSSCCARTTRAWRSSWTWSGSSRTPWATPGCCCTCARRA